MSDAIHGRVIRVLNYIHDNPAADLSLDALADVAAMSRFHWHRVWRATMRETLADSVRRVRLHRAAAMLVHTTRPVPDVAARVGYPNARSFARTFAEAYGMTPAAFRTRGIPGAVLRAPLKGDPAMNYDVTIRQEPERRVAALRHIGAYTDIGHAFQKLSAMMAEHGLFAHAGGMIAISYDDPSSVPEAELRSDAGFIMTGDAALPEGIATVTVPAGRHAVARHVGPYIGLSAAYDALYSDWLPQADETPADAPPFELYLNSPMEVKPDDLVTEVCLPLR